MTRPLIDTTTAPKAPPLGQPTPANATAPLPSDQLLRGRKTVEISHNGAVYRLQQTRQGKLILTK
ncbi:hemin uptake protein HemP [Ottowia sp.]|uniref:hemin uptake protein HemP n=1 Tax=Ottowia sp. TaxID=1898956 RepID=UPI002B537337|nr:hemin uptake protein HemP [Ottowia sp.]HOB66847.1 hemin uptake protein HemP [Ottowia sp.]HPZ55885.1 hemin uptake protein HemP [Ottowia sp.]HQD47987.1 hemin uptake protein HemP [Ottowia sp.]